MLQNKNYKNVISFKKLDAEFNNISQRIEKLKLPQGFFQFLLYSLSEIFDNIKEHSQAKKAFVEIKMNKNFSINVGDDGIGLRNSYLLKGIYPKDDASAIEFALAGLSTKDLKERGYGLYTIKKFIENLKGKMEIKSGKALAEIKEKRIQFKNLSRSQKGVEILLRAKVQEIDFYKVIK